MSGKSASGAVLQWKSLSKIESSVKRSRVQWWTELIQNGIQLLQRLTHADSKRHNGQESNKTKTVASQRGGRKHKAEEWTSELINWLFEDHLGEVLRRAPMLLIFIQSRQTRSLHLWNGRESLLCKQHVPLNRKIYLEITQNFDEWILTFPTEPEEGEGDLSNFR